MSDIVQQIAAGTPLFGVICEHGRLKRSCDTCGFLAQITDLLKQIADFEKHNGEQAVVIAGLKDALSQIAMFSSAPNSPSDIIHIRNISHTVLTSLEAK